MRVLHVIDSLGAGGAESSLVAMTPHLKDAGIKVHVLPLGPADELLPAMRAAGAVIHSRETELGRSGNLRAVAQCIRIVQPQIVHTTLFEADIAGRLAAWRAGIPVISSIVSDSYGPSHRAEVSQAKLAGAQIADVLTAKTVTAFHAISTAIATSVAPRLHIRRERIHVIPRGRDAADFPFRPMDRRLETRRALGAGNRPVILGLGRQEPPKALDILLGAAHDIAAESPEAVIWLAGRQGRATALLQERAARSPLEVIFLGHRQDVANLLAGADVLAFPSRREGFGGVLIEAMAVGCPVVASEIPTSLEVLGANGRCALLVGPQNEAALAAGLLNTLRHPDAARSRADRAHARFLENYTISATSRAMADLYLRVLRRSRGSAAWG